MEKPASLCSRRLGKPLMPVVLRKEGFRFASRPTRSMSPYFAFHA